MNVLNFIASNANVTLSLVYANYLKSGAVQA